MNTEGVGARPETVPTSIVTEAQANCKELLIHIYSYLTTSFTRVAA